MMLDFIKGVFLYSHLIVLSLTLTLVLSGNLYVFKQIFLEDRVEILDKEKFKELRTSLTSALSILWITGIILAIHGIFENGIDFLDGYLMQHELSVTILLSLNVFMLTTFSSPLMKKAGSLFRLAYKEFYSIATLGVLTGVSFFYAPLAGIFNPDVWGISVVEMLAAYPIIFIVVIVLASLVMHSYHKKFS